MNTEQIKAMIIHGVSGDTLHEQCQEIANQFEKVKKDADKYHQIRDRATVDEANPDAVLFSRNDIKNFTTLHLDTPGSFDQNFYKWLVNPEPVTADALKDGPKIGKISELNSKVKHLSDYRKPDQFVRQIYDLNNEIDNANRARIEAEANEKAVHEKNAYLQTQADCWEKTAKEYHEEIIDLQRKIQSLKDHIRTI